MRRHGLFGVALAILARTTSFACEPPVNLGHATNVTEGGVTTTFAMPDSVFRKGDSWMWYLSVHNDGPDPLSLSLPQNPIELFAMLPEGCIRFDAEGCRDSLFYMYPLIIFPTGGELTLQTGECHTRIIVWHGHMLDGSRYPAVGRYTMLAGIFGMYEIGATSVIDLLVPDHGVTLPLRVEPPVEFTTWGRLKTRY